MRWLLQLALAALIGALISAGAVYSLMREPEVTAPPREPEITAPPADLVDSAHGLDLCRSAASRQVPGDRPRLLAAFDTSAGEYAAWSLDVRPGEPSGVSQFVQERMTISPSTPITLCYFDSDEPYARSTPPPHRARIVVDGYGGSSNEGIANRDRMPVRRPGDGPFHG